MLRIVLCDDSSQFLSVLKGYVEKECRHILPDGEDFEVGPAFGSGRGALEYIANNHVDVILLDIDMPGLSGFDVAKVLCNRYKDIKIVFMSAYDNFVYNSFDFFPFAYIRKSHITEEFSKVLKRIVEKSHESERRLMLNTTSGVKNVEFGSIRYAESERNYYKIFLIHNKTYLCRGTLTELEKAVNSSDFFRIHSAYLINLEHVERLLENDMVLVGSSALPIAQKRMQGFKKAYMEYVRRCFGT